MLVHSLYRPWNIFYNVPYRASHIPLHSGRIPSDSSHKILLHVCCYNKDVLMQTYIRQRSRSIIQYILEACCYYLLEDNNAEQQKEVKSWKLSRSYSSRSVTWRHRFSHK